jgi:hypothetical protein
MPSDADKYTLPKVPEGYVETMNEQGETVWRLADLEIRRQSRTRHQREEFLLLKLSGLVSTLGIHPRITLPALIVLMFAVQRDRTFGQPLKITRDLVAKSGHSRYALYRAVDWLEENLTHFVTVSRAPGKANRLELTQKGRKALHPLNSKGVRI